MLEVFKNMRVLDRYQESLWRNWNCVTKRMKFLNGWTITISSLLMLWGDITKTPNFVLCTYRFNHDIIENLFGTFQNKNGNNHTPIQFLWASKKIFFVNYFKHSEGSNCLECLEDISEIVYILYTCHNFIIIKNVSSNPIIFFYKKMSTYKRY